MAILIRVLERDGEIGLEVEGVEGDTTLAVQLLASIGVAAMRSTLDTWDDMTNQAEGDLN